jgi:gluconate 2-dehydrogenase
MKDVVIVPHFASVSCEMRLWMAMMASENLVAGLTGERPSNLMNAEVFSS